MKQFTITTAMGKRLIGKGIAAHPAVKQAIEKGTLVIVAGTTNGYVAEEALTSIGQASGFSRVGFRRGTTTAPSARAPKHEFPGDVVITKGEWQQGQTIFDVADTLKLGDMILKGGNAFDTRGQAAVLIGDRRCGTVLEATAAHIGRRVQLIVPIGLEKRVPEDVYLLAQRCNAPGAEGARLYPMPGTIFTELDAIKLLTGADACLLAAGGIYGAEGSSWIGVDGTEADVWATAELIRSIADEPPCEV